MLRSLEFYLSFLEVSIEFGIKGLAQRHLGFRTSCSCPRAWQAECGSHRYHGLMYTQKHRLKAGPCAGEHNSSKADPIYIIIYFMYMYLLVGMCACYLVHVGAQGGQEKDLFSSSIVSFVLSAEPSRASQPNAGILYSTVNHELASVPRKHLRYHLPMTKTLHRLPLPH